MEPVNNYEVDVLIPFVKGGSLKMDEMVQARFLRTNDGAGIVNRV